MKIVALLAIRNEAPYLARCLRHLADQGVDTVVIDNDSEDDSVAIARGFEGRGVIGIERLPYPGHYDWQAILQRKAALAASLEADWFIHHDADEIRESMVPGQTLAQALAAADAEGFNAVDFLEFVFVPTRRDEDVRGQDYVAALPFAYYFQPRPLHRVNAWKKTAAAVDLLAFGGHQAVFEGRRVWPQPLILRHYPFLSWQHLVDKYSRQRRYSDYEVNTLGWHGRRACFDEQSVWLPPESMLVRPAVDGWDTRRPWRSHPFLGEGRE